MNRIYKNMLVNENGIMQWYERLQKELWSKRLQHYEVADKTGMDVNILFDKINGKGMFTEDEVIIIKQKIGLEQSINEMLTTSDIGCEALEL